MKKKLSKSNYRFLESELTDQRNRGIINQGQLDDMMTFYEEDLGMNFIRVLVTIGSILVGLGVLSFVASNWASMGKMLKIMVIIGALGISMLGSFKIEKNYPKTSKALLYLSALIYGSGIFLIGQIFNYGGEFTAAFLLWTIGVLSIALILKEEILFLFAHVLALIYINGSFGENIIIYSLLFMGAFYIGNKTFHYDKVVTFFNNVIGLNFLLYLLDYLDVAHLYMGMIFFILGLLMVYMNHKLNVDIFRLQGMIVVGISGLTLTSQYVWKEVGFIQNGNIPAVGFAILLLIYLLTLVRKGLLTPLLFTCLLILRYYFDTLYDFMPKSLFFITGGLILLGFGFYFERVRKNRGGVL